MKLQTAQMIHTENTMKALTKYQDRVCHPVLNYIGSAGSILLVILAIMLEPHIGKINTSVFSFIGCWFFITNRHRSRQLLDEIIKNFKGKMPVMQYSFQDAGIVIRRDKKQETIPYAQITDLAESTNYGFFVYQKKVAFMFDKRTVENFSELKEFLSKKTKGSWKKTAGKHKKMFK